jgi:peptidoglycan/LPS O-acetylase OafA/YrhL
MRPDAQPPATQRVHADSVRKVRAEPIRRGLATGRPAALARLLDARPLRRLGASSYSLYLTHAPIVVIVYDRVVAGRFRPGVPAFAATAVLALPLATAFAWAFASVFERPYRLARRRSGRPTGAALGVSAP